MDKNKELQEDLADLAAKLSKIRSANGTCPQPYKIAKYLLNF